jgi:L-methionine (R)-S-oxide reductase
MERGKADRLLAELLRLDGLSDSHGSLDAHLGELTSAAARVLDAQSCTFTWLSSQQRMPDPEAIHGDPAPYDAIASEVAFDAEAIAGEPAPIQVRIGTRGAVGFDDAPGCSTLRSPIRSNGRVVAMVEVSGPLHKSGFDQEDLWLLDIVSLYSARSLHTVQLQNVLHSRFAQMALAQSVEDTVGKVLAAVPEPGRMVRILAKSFYREMTKAGFGANEIINAASQIISELSASLKRHAKRHEGGPAAPSKS